MKFTDVSSGGAIFSTNLLSTWSEMTLFYSNDEEDSLVYPFIISTYAAYFGEFRHNYATAQPAFRSQVLEGDTSLGKNTIYLQKFDVDNSDGKLYWHQYMGNIQAPFYEAASIAKAYADSGLTSSAMAFILPFFFFSATAGQLADKYDKALLARLT